MKTFAIVNRKGGVGKTTTAINLAYVLATSCQKRVLLIDADGQGNATSILLPRGEYEGLGSLFRGCATCYDQVTQPPDVPGLDVLPASEDLWAVDLEAVTSDARRGFQVIADLRDAVAEDGAYDISTKRWLIRPPVSAGEITAEGKALHHCVGGYAERHVKGSTTILFLRDRKQPGKPLVTIEMKGAQIVQIHGYQNDSGQTIMPMVRYAAILDPWLAWLAAGSKRNKDGTPKLPNKETSLEQAAHIA